MSGWFSEVWVVEEGKGQKSVVGLRVSAEQAEQFEERARYVREDIASAGSVRRHPR